MNTPTIRYGSDIEWMPPQIETCTGTDGFLDTYEDVLMSIGSKESPTRVKGVGQYHNDTVFTEGATEIAHSTDDLLTKMHKLHTHLEAVTGMTLKGYDHIILPQFNERDFPFLSAQAMNMGCAPDTRYGEIRTVPQRVRKQILRESGLHLHFDLPQSKTQHFTTGYSPSGIPVLIDPTGFVSSAMRDFAEATKVYHTPELNGFMQWYRLPGTYRVKPYGVEYRSIGANIFNDTDRLAGLLSTVSLFVNDLWRVFE